MKTTDIPEKMADPVITEVRAIKKELVAEHGADLDSFFAAVRKRQVDNPRLVKKSQKEDSRGGAENAE